MKVENYDLNQRFRVYRNFVTSIIGSKTFTHYEYPKVSAYLLVNNSNANIRIKEQELINMFRINYMDLPDIG